MPEFVHWKELEPKFSKLFPLTIDDVTENLIVAKVLYLGIPFYIWPDPDLSPSAFQVWGNAFLNAFPS